MTTFDEREKGFEREFIHKQELAFKAAIRCHKLLGLWAAEKMGRQGEQAEQYAYKLAELQIDDRRKDIISRILHDLTQAGLPVTNKEVRAEYERLSQLAQKQVMGDNQEA